MNAKTPSYHGYRFPPEIISHAVWLYYRFCLSFRDVEDLLAERGSSSPTRPSDSGLGSLVQRTLESSSGGKDAWATLGTWTSSL